MAEATTTNHFRRRLAKRMFDESALPKIGMMAFGDGGHNTDGTPKAPSADRTALVNERIRKVLVSVAQAVASRRARLKARIWTRGAAHAHSA